MTDKQLMGRFAPLYRWLGGVTEKDLMKGLAVIVAAAVLSAATSYSTTSSLEVQIAGAGGMLRTASAVVAAIVTLLGWLLSTLIYHAVSHLIGGKGNLKRMFALNGYASVPILGLHLLRFLYYTVLNQPVSTISNTRLHLIFGSFNVFTVIALILTGVAVMINYGLSGRRSALIALLPTILILVFGLVLTL